MIVAVIGSIIPPFLYPVALSPPTIWINPALRIQPAGTVGAREALVSAGGSTHEDNVMLWITFGDICIFYDKKLLDLAL